MFLETIAYSWFNSTSHNPCTPLHANDTLSKIAVDELLQHYPALKDTRIPALFYMNIACGMPKNLERDPGPNKLTYWHSTQPGEWQHPSCGVHSILAHTLLEYFNSLKLKACTAEGGYKKVAARSASTKQAAKALNLEQRCVLEPKTILSSEFGFPANVSKESAWEYGEDAKGKPGWIANWKSKTKPDQDIVFDVNLELGMVKFEYLSTYENIGKAVCWVEGEGTYFKKNLLMIALWNVRKSISAYASMKTSCRGKCQVRCRPLANQKFKILSLVSC